MAGHIAVEHLSPRSTVGMSRCAWHSPDCSAALPGYPSLSGASSSTLVNTCRGAANHEMVGRYR